MAENEWPDGWPVEAVAKIEALEEENARLTSDRDWLTIVKDKAWVRVGELDVELGKLLSDNARLRDEITRLTSERATTRKVMAGVFKDQADRIAELEEALRPFANLDDYLQEEADDRFWVMPGIQAQDIRTARALLPAAGEKDAPEEEVSP